MICHCEKVSLGEIMDALKSPIPATTLEGLKRRTRCTQGRCQGFHCQADAVAILAKATGVSTDRIIALEDNHE
jgi:glycerol-3-phosphate dehydrogenase